MYNMCSSSFSTVFDIYSILLYYLKYYVHIVFLIHQDGVQEYSFLKNIFISETDIYFFPNFLFFIFYNLIIT